MPGYRSLSSHLSGTAAQHAREAELCQRDGDSETAARLLEEALEASALARPELPGWVCGRLASIYRTLKRYDDEVRLLERFRESQSSEEARTRFDARLSKARAVAERKRRPDTGALETVRQVRDRSSQRRRTPVSSPTIDAAVPLVRASQVADLRDALSDFSDSGDDHIRVVIARFCHEAMETGVSMERLVMVLKSTWLEAPIPEGVSDERWHERYSTTLVEMMATYFGETGG